MSWLRIKLTAAELEIVRSERETHPNSVVRRRFTSLWLLHHGLKRAEVAKIMEVAVSTVERFVSDYRVGGLEALRKSGRNYRPTSELAPFQEQIRASFERQPARTIAEAGQRIKELTGVERKPTQVRVFLKGLGLSWQRVRAIPVPPKKTWQSMSPTKPSFSTTN